MYNRVFEPGQCIDFCHNTLWYQGVIDIALDEMVKCIAAASQNNSQPVVHWIELESEKLAPPQSITGNDREHLHKFFVDLSSFVIRGQQR